MKKFIPIVAVIALLLLIGTILGVVRNDGSSGRSESSTSNIENNPDNSLVQLLNEKITFSSNEFKKTQADNWGPGIFCGEVPASGAVCTEHVVVVPSDASNEFNYVDYHIQIATFDNDELQADEWLNKFIQGSSSDISEYDLDDVTAYKKTIDGVNGVNRIFVAIPIDDSIVLINSDFGSLGENTQYQQQFDDFVQSAQIN